MFERNGHKLGSVLREDTEPSPTEDSDPYESATVAELKDMLTERDLPVSGNKAELLERLREAGAADENDDEEGSDGSDDAE